MISTLALGAYRNSRRSGRDLLAAAASIDESIESQIGRGRFATGQMASLDTTSGALRVLNAGHPPPLLIRPGQVTTMSCPPRPPLGLAHLVPGGRDDVVEEQLQPGDGVLLYTDGVIEARTPGGEDFGAERLQELLSTASAASTGSAEALRQVANAVVDHHGGSLADDATMLLVVWRPGH